MPSATAPAAARLPAWKRLGLKLKSAQVPEQISEPSAESILSKRKNKDLIKQPLSKKVKKTKSSLLPTSTEEPFTPNLTRKKSVTFTPETKIEDGDSIKQLFSAWVAEQKTQDPSFQPKSSQVFNTPQPPKVEEQVDTTLNEKERRVKRVKVKKAEEKTEQPQSTTKQRKPKSPKPSKITKATKAPTRPFLLYLRQYHESRDAWKFNKNHQNHLLKHVFNVEVIPSDHAHLIYEYVRGLQGGVRTRLRDEAFAIKVKDQDDGPAGFPETMSERDKRQREYDAAMKEFVATMTAANASSKMGYEEGVLLGLSDAAMAERVAKRMRAEKILKELGTSDEDKAEAEASRQASGVPGPKMTYSDDDSQKRLRMNDGSSQKVVRKRKQRTTAADDDTSSSGESSDSESSTDDNSATPLRRHTQVETSSSSSSSSSSESDDEDDEDEDDEEHSEESDSE
jgi:hypothetical protein